jgi:hypothetical protein
MPNFRTSVDPVELLANTDPALLEEHTTVYDPDRGGHYPPRETTTNGQTQQG